MSSPKTYECYNNVQCYNISMYAIQNKYIHIINKHKYIFM